jgi:hypothetical protein
MRVVGCGICVRLRSVVPTGVTGVIEVYNFVRS